MGVTNSHVNKPNFFILGAGRCGSTHLHSLLRQHPDIFLTSIKEPTFFCHPFQIVKNPIKYFELYEGASDEKFRGEASHAYLSNPATARILISLFPESRFVVTLRNPAVRAYSLYHWMRRHGFENLSTFEAALEAEESRYKSDKFRNNSPQYFYNSMYFRSGLYGEQLQRYFALFPKQQFHIINFEKFIKDPVDQLKGVFRFLGINEDFSPKLDVKKNAGTLTTRIPAVHYFVKTKLKPCGGLKNHLLWLLRKTNLMEVPPMREDTKSALLDRYSSDLELLYELTGISFDQ